MSRIVDRGQMEASLHKAGLAAVAGTYDELSGRSGSGAADIAMRMRNELRIATMNWATVETFNSKFETFRDGLLDQHAWEPALFAVRAIVRDVILTLFRVTDASGANDDLETVCALVGTFNGKSAGEIAASTGADVTDVEAGLRFINERVPRRWGRDEPPPSCRELAELRDSLRPIRDGLIAHAKTYSSLDLRSTVPKTRSFLRVASELSDAACMICNVPRDDLQDGWIQAMAASGSFWDVVKSGANQAT